MSREQFRMRGPVAVFLLLLLFGGLGVNHITGKLLAPGGGWNPQREIEGFLSLFLRTPATPIKFTGTPGTPVLIGIKPDRSPAFTCTATLPTNITVRFRRRVVCTVKNLGSNFADLMMSGSSRDPHGDFIPPFFGHSHTILARPGRYDDEYDYSMVRPIDWPEALPPGIDRKEAEQRNFTNDFFQARLDAFLAIHTQESKNPGALVGVIASLRGLKRTNDSLFYYEKSMASDCSEPYWLREAAYSYVQLGGTNLDLAYAAAVKAEEMHPKQDAANHAYFRSTVGYVLVHRGDYEQALTCFSGKDPDTLYAKGLAHYMLLQEEPAREAFTAVVAAGAKQLKEFPEYPLPQEWIDAREFLDVLEVAPTARRAKALKLLRERLSADPQDPGALSRLALLHPDQDQIPPDGLVHKALGFAAFRRGDYAGAVTHGSEALRTRATDPGLLFYYGQALEREGRRAEAVRALQKAMSLGLKLAQIDEARRLIAQMEATGGRN